MNQNHIFQAVFKRYKHLFPNMLHGSGGLCDAKGPNASDVDVCIYSNHHSCLAKHFPKNTKVLKSNQHKTIYSIPGYSREVNIYCSNHINWNRPVFHRRTELALERIYPKLAQQAFLLKQKNKLSTEDAWVKTLNIQGDCFTALTNTKHILKLAQTVNKSTK